MTGKSGCTLGLDHAVFIICGNTDCGAIETLASNCEYLTTSTIARAGADRLNLGKDLNIPALIASIVAVIGCCALVGITTHESSINNSVFGRLRCTDIT